VFAIESKGPYGSVSRVVPRSSVKEVLVVRSYGFGLGFSMPTDGSVRCLAIHLRDGECMEVLPDRSEGEYRLILSNLRNGLGLE
jgi:hypothetical protein